jgi:cytoskeletal protein CcmA (bactofilin family)
MWRKQEDPKPAPSVSDVAMQPRVEPPIQAVPTMQAPVAPTREVSAPTGHITSTQIIVGEITGSQDLFIDGEVQGRIYLDEGKVTIGPNGRVTADVEASEIVVLGKVKGNLYGRERVQIGATGYTNGDLVAGRVVVEEGAEIHGRVEIARSQEQSVARVASAAAGAGGSISMMQARGSSTVA